MQLIALSRCWLFALSLLLFGNGNSVEVPGAALGVQSAKETRGQRLLGRLRREATAAAPAVEMPKFYAKAGRARAVSLGPKMARFLIKCYGIPENATCTQLRPCECDGGLGQVEMYNQMIVKGGRKVPYWHLVHNDDETLFAVDRFSSAITVSRPGHYLITAILSFNQVRMDRELFVNLLVNGTTVMSRRFDERLFCMTLQVVPGDPEPQKTREKCLKQNVQAEFHYQAAFNGPVSIALGTSIDMGAHMPILMAEKLTHLTVTRFGPASRDKQVEKAV